jgi:hypothetical protein
MKLSDLEASFRTDADDAVAPYLWSSEEVIGWINEAEEEACLRGKLIFEGSRPEITQIAVTVAGGNTYKLHDALFEINYASLTDASGCTNELLIKSRDQLTRELPDWRTNTDVPKHLVHYDKTVQLGAVVGAPYTLKVEGFRYPIKCMKAEQDVPEIGRTHHIHLVQWVLYRAYAKPDSETLNKDKSKEALQNFEDYFGPRPDSDLRKDVNADLPHVNKVHY